MKLSSIFSIGLGLLALYSCTTSEPRRPVRAQSGTFMKTSIERSKQLLAEEEALIGALISRDSLKDYLKSPNGYWYRYETRDTSGRILPAEGDLLKITYNLRTLSEDTLYSMDEIGEISFKVDKEDYFPGLRTAVKLLKEGESATFYFPSSLAYGYHGDEEKIGTNIPLIATVKHIKLLERAADSSATTTPAELKNP